MYKVKGLEMFVSYTVKHDETKLMLLRVVNKLVLKHDMGSGGFINMFMFICSVLYNTYHTAQSEGAD